MDQEPAVGEDDSEVRLAAALGTDEASFVEAFGAGWRDVPTPHDYDSNPSGEFEGLYGPWHASGDPAQLMLRVMDDDLQLAAPKVDGWATSW